MKAKYLFAILTLISFSHPVKSAWFGPDNFEECQYEKVKDCSGDTRCANVAITLCEKEFPYELGEWKKIDWEDYDNSDNKIQIVAEDFLTKICFTNERLNLKRDCSWWEYDLNTAYSWYAMNLLADKKFLNSDQSNFLDGTTYIVYRAERKRIEK